MSRTRRLNSPHRPLGVTALAALFAFGVLASVAATVSLLWPGSWLEPIWCVNPRGHATFLQMGPLAFLVLIPLSVVCALAALGFMRGLRWGYWLGLSLLLTNLAGSLINGLSGAEPEALVGVPVVALSVWYLSRLHVRAYFGSCQKWK